MPDSPQPGNLVASASQRLSSVPDINQGGPATTDPAEAVVTSGTGAEPAPSGANATVDSFEDQINTSMTQTMQALNTRSNSTQDDDDDDESTKGFFSRFRRK